MEICNPYTIFSKYYDNILDHVNYNRWKSFILSEFVAQKTRNPAQIVDLGCGTGNLLGEFQDISTSNTGFDISGEMLEIARNKYPNSNFIQSNLLNFSLKIKTDLLICTHDTLNYLTNLQELEEHFKCARSNLSEDGLYFFDVTSEYNLLENFHEIKIEQRIPDGKVIWTNEYNKRKKILKSELTFITQGKSMKEIHHQKYFSPDEISIAIHNSGLQIHKIGSDYKKWELDTNACLINFLVSIR